MITRTQLEEFIQRAPEVSLLVLDLFKHEHGHLDSFAVQKTMRGWQIDGNVICIQYGHVLSVEEMKIPIERLLSAVGNTDENGSRSKNADQVVKQKTTAELLDEFYASGSFR